MGIVDVEELISAAAGHHVRHEMKCIYPKVKHVYLCTSSVAMVVPALTGTDSSDAVSA